MSTKTCTKCHVEYPATAEFFSLNKRCRDGLQSPCRVCHRALSKAWNKSHPDRCCAASSRYQAAHPEVCHARNVRWRLANPGRVCAMSARSRKKHSKAVKAVNALNHAIRAGRVVRPDSCSRCGRPCKPDMHHPNYDQPLQTIPVCRKCHKAIHARKEVSHGEANGD